MLSIRSTPPLLGLTALAALLLTGRPAAAQTITFSGLTAPNDTPLFSPYSEGGFKVQFTTSGWRVGQQFGKPVASIFSREDTATVDVTSIGGALFSFQNVDLGNGGEFVPTYTLTGLRSGVPQFTTGGDLNGAQQFETVSSPSPATLIDDLRVTLKRQQTISVNIDNIALTSAAVPEASSMISVGLGTAILGGLVLVARKRKVQSAS